MKPLLLLFALSLAANGYFAVREHDATRVSSRPDHSSHRSAPPGKSNTPPTSNSTVWTRLAQGDTTALAALRAAGWPEETLQLLIVAVVTERLRPENADGTHAEPLNYWDEQLESNAFPELRRKNLLAQKQEKVAILKGPLGEAYQPPEAEELFFQGLPRGKVTAVAAIKADYATMRNELVAQEGAGKSASSDQYALLTREERADIARTLSPDEFFEYELRNSVTASELRHNTSAFEPTEAEFRALFSIKNPLDEPAFNLDTIAAGKLRKDTEAQLDAQARTLLSEERFKQFVRSRDAEYRRYYALGKYLQLPAATANTAYEIKADIDQRARALEAASPTDNERRALAQEAESRLTATFGAKGMEIYKLNSRYLYLLTIPPSARPGGR